MQARVFGLIYKITFFLLGSMLNAKVNIVTSSDLMVLLLLAFNANCVHHASSTPVACERLLVLLF